MPGSSTAGVRSSGAVSASNPTITSHDQPQRRGSSIMCWRLKAKTIDATRAATATTSPASVDQTGAAVAP